MDQKKADLEFFIKILEQVKQTEKNLDEAICEAKKTIEHYERIIPLPTQEDRRHSHGQLMTMNSTNTNNSEKSYGNSSTTMFSTRYLSTKKNSGKGWRSTPRS